MRDGIVPIVTRFRPTRADELVGGSLYWIIKHRIAARQTILGFDRAAVGPQDDHPARSGAGDGARDGEARRIRAGAISAPPTRRPTSATAATAWRRCRPISPASSRSWR